jgi:hypothetical protein
LGAKLNLNGPQSKSGFVLQNEVTMNVVALPVDDGYATLGHLMERGHVIEAIRMDGISLGLFSTAVAAVAALVEIAQTQDGNNSKKRHVQQ